MIVVSHMGDGGAGGAWLCWGSCDVWVVDHLTLLRSSVAVVCCWGHSPGVLGVGLNCQLLDTLSYSHCKINAAGQDRAPPAHTHLSPILVERMTQSFIYLLLLDLYGYWIYSRSSFHCLPLAGIKELTSTFWCL